MLKMYILGITQIVPYKTYKAIVIATGLLLIELIKELFLHIRPMSIELYRKVSSTKVIILICLVHFLVTLCPCPCTAVAGKLPKSGHSC